MRLSPVVFKAPSYPMLFSVLVGMGLQYSFVTAFFLIVANLGMHIDVHMREYLYLLFLTLSAMTGSIGGFLSGRLYKFFNGQRWKRHATLTVVAVPAFVLSILAAMTLAEKMEINRFG